MPSWPTPGDRREDHAQAAGDAAGLIYDQAEQVIIAAIASLARKVASGSMTAKTAVRQLRSTVAQVFSRAAPPARKVLDDAMSGAAAQARGTLAPTLPLPKTFPLPGLYAEPLAVSLDTATGNAAQAAEDALTAVTAAMARVTGAAVTAGGMTGLPPVPPDRYAAALDRAFGKFAGYPGQSLSYRRLQAAQVMLDDLADQGVTGFVDKAGRRWDLASYVEMATRTAVSNAWDDMQAGMAVRSGLDLVETGTTSTEGSCRRCVPWLGKTLSLAGATPGYPTVAEAKAAGWRHPNCFPGTVLVSAPSGIDAGYAHWYEGDLLVIHTASGNQLPVTPNHPVATPEGWIGAGQLKVGQRVLRYDGGDQRVKLMGPRYEQVPARIGDVFDALRHASSVPAVRMPSAPEQFHGDGSGPYVEVVLADRLLKHHGDAEGVEFGTDSAFFGGSPGLVGLLAGSPLGEVGLGAGRASHGVMGRASERLALCAAHRRQAPAVPFGLANIAAVLDQDLADLGAVDVEFAGYADHREIGRVVQAQGFGAPGGVVAATWPLDTVPLDANSPESRSQFGPDFTVGADLNEVFSGLVTLDRVIEIERRSFAGHVYNLQTKDGWYAAESLIVHNCRCFWHPVGAGYAIDVTNPVPAGEAAEAYEASQRQRAHERNVRAAGRRLQAAVTPQAKARAHRDLAAAKAASAAHRQRHGVVMMKVTVQRRERPFGPR